MNLIPAGLIGQCIIVSQVMTNTVYCLHKLKFNLTIYLNFKNKSID